MPGKTHGLGRRANVDQRDRMNLLAEHLPERASMPTSKHWRIDARHLDQGNTGSCVGHAWRNFLRCEPVQTSALHPSAYDVYRQAVLLDPWVDNDGEAQLADADPGLDSGTTVRAGAKAMCAMGELKQYLWAFSLQPAIEWLLTQGPVVIGINWYDSMFTPDAAGRVRIATGSGIAGGHCVLVRGADQRRGLVTCVNSWGDGWGKGGDFLLSLRDFERLILEDGEICTAIQAPAGTEHKAPTEHNAP